MKKQEQLSFIDEKNQTDNEPVVCLGMTFNNDDERREYFRNELRKKLPKLKQIEGFPIGEDEDIIALSDPPYYTACPNPWINDFIEEWEKEKNEKYNRNQTEEYHREPFAADVSEGKNTQIYKLHGYHTKVPHTAILKYLYHYTKPGDIVIDCFSGSGMTGVATQLSKCEKSAVEAGYEVIDSNKGLIQNSEGEISILGERKVILSDLSPAASFISYNYNVPINLQNYEKKLNMALEEVVKECDWMFKTQHVVNNKVQYDPESNEIIYGKINYLVWSDVFICPECSNEIIFWNTAVDHNKGKVMDKFQCTHCNVDLSKNKLERSWVTKYDSKINQSHKVAKQVPVLIKYSVGSKRYDKNPDENDYALIEKIDQQNIPYWHPIDQLPEGYNTNQPKLSHGVNYVHHFYTKRNLWALSSFAEKVKNSPEFINVISVAVVNTLLYRYRWAGGVPGAGGGPLAGTYYIPSLIKDLSILNSLKQYIQKSVKNKSNLINRFNSFVLSTQTATSFNNLASDAVDYIFVDPPFGSNLMYSELNFIWESWIKVFTNNKTEAIVNPVQNKSLDTYQNLIVRCFKELYRVLKPGRWMTVEFSNSQASVWNSIQEAIQKAGFVIANVSALDKKQGSFKAVTTTTAVKQDLVISAYKPRQENIEKMQQEQNTENSAWTFVRQHLEQLPVFLGIKGEAQIITERTPRILFDRMVAYHVQNGFNVPISSSDFQLGVAQRFPMRDGMAFLESQVPEYDKKRTLVRDFAQMSLFVSDESSAIEWIRQQLLKKPQTRQDIHPQYMKEIQHIAKHEILPELDDLLHQNFLRYEGEEQVPDQILAYLRRTYKDLRGLEPNNPKLIEKGSNRWYVPDPNKQADLEKLREKSLLREFEGYLEELEKSKKKLKQFRTEAIRAGFKKAWSDKDFEKIVKIGERLPESVIQEDDKLLMYFDNAQIRLGL